MELVHEFFDDPFSEYVLYYIASTTELESVVDPKMVERMFNYNVMKNIKKKMTDHICKISETRAVRRFDGGKFRTLYKFSVDDIMVFRNILYEEAEFEHFKSTIRLIHDVETRERFIEWYVRNVLTILKSLSFYIDRLYEEFSKYGEGVVAQYESYEKLKSCVNRIKPFLFRLNE